MTLIRFHNWDRKLPSSSDGTFSDISSTPGNDLGDTCSISSWIIYPNSSTGTSMLFITGNYSDAGEGIFNLWGFNTMSADALAPKSRQNRHVRQTTNIVVADLISPTWVKPNPRYDSKCEYIFCYIYNNSTCSELRRRIHRDLYDPILLPEASFGLRVLSLPAYVCPCVCVSITGLSAR